MPRQIESPLKGLLQVARDPYALQILEISKKCCGAPLGAIEIRDQLMRARIDSAIHGLALRARFARPESLPAIRSNGDSVERRFARTEVQIRNVPQPDIRKGPPMEGLFLCLAGGQGFEPWLAESESAVLPLDDPPSAPPISSRAYLIGADLPLVPTLRISNHRLALRVLRCATCFAQAHFLALNFASVTSYEACFTQCRPQ